MPITDNSRNTEYQEFAPLFDELADDDATEQERARLRDDLRERRVSGPDVSAGAGENPAWAGLRVRWLLEALPGIGPVRAERLMDEIDIAPTRRIQGLGSRQRDALVAALQRSGR